MNIHLGIALDSMTPPQTHGLGVVRVGPVGFLGVLQNRLGLPSLRTSPAARLVAWREVLKRFDNGERFYSASFATDELATAEKLLGLRDEWRLYGWSGEVEPGCDDRIAQMAELNAQAKELPPSYADSLHEMLRMIEGGAGHDIHGVELLDPLEHFPPMLQRLLTHFTVTPPSQTQAMAPKDSDLVGLQNALLDPTHKPTYKGDGTVVFLRAQSPITGSRILAEHLRTIRPKQTTVALLVHDGGASLDDALEAAGEPRVGFGSDSAFRPVLQLLPLSLQLLWEPLDPVSLLQFLGHEVHFLRSGVRRALAACVATYPGIGSEHWASAQEGALAAIEDAQKRAKAKEEIDFWLDRAPLFDPKSGARIDRIVEMIARLTGWLGGFSTLHQGTALSDSTKVALAQAEDLRNALLSLKASGEDKIAREQLFRLSDQILQAGAALGREAQCGAVMAATEPGALYGEYDELFWWGGAGGFVPPFDPLSPQQYEQLKGCTPLPRRLKLKALASQWARPVLAARKRLVVVLFANQSECHPLLLKLASLVGVNLEDLKALDTDSCDAFGIQLAQSLYKPLASPPALWRLASKVPSRPVESFSSLSLFLQKPHEWMLRYQARLYAPDFLSVSDQGQLMGNLAHSLFEHFFMEEWKPGYPPLGAQQWAKKQLPRLLREQGAMLLLPGRMAMRRRFEAALLHSFSQLSDHLERIGVSEVVMEKRVEGSFTVAGHTQAVVGLVDLIAQSPSGQKVIDLKWRGAKWRAKELTSGTHLQLLLYGYILSSGQNWPELAYHTIEEARTLSDREYPPPFTHEQSFERFLKSWGWRRSQLDEGTVEMTIEQRLEDEEILLPPEDGFLQTELTDGHNSDYRNLLGLWRQS